MRVRACPLVFAMTLAFGSSARAGELEAPRRPTPLDAPVESSWLAERLGSASRLLWGMGEWPLPALEAERRSFGMRLEFRFGDERSERGGGGVR